MCFKFFITLNRSSRQTMSISGNKLLWLDRISRWILAGVMLAAGVPKLLSPHAFAGVIEAYGLLPEFFIFPAAVLLPLLEVIAAVQLIRAKKSGLWLTAGLMVIFIAVLSYGIWLGLDIDCGCFGPEDPEHEAFSGLRTALVRDLLLCIPMLFSFGYLYLSSSKQCGEQS